MYELLHAIVDQLDTCYERALSHLLIARLNMSLLRLAAANGVAGAHVAFAAGFEES